MFKKIAGAPVYEQANRSALLVLSFIVPVQPLLHLRTWRPVELILFAMTIAALAGGRRIRFPRILQASFVIGTAGACLATIFSNRPVRSLDVTALEFFMPFAVMYLFAAFASGRFLIKVLTLFMLGALITGAVQSATIIKAAADVGQFRMPLAATNFLFYKMYVPYLFPGGVPDAYGNIDNYASLWALLVPLAAGGLYVTRRWYLAVAMLAIIGFSGLVVYSRSALIAAVLGIVAIIIIRAVIFRSVALGLIAVLAAVGAIHLDIGSMRYFESGISNFAKTIDTQRPVVVVETPAVYPKLIGQPTVSATIETHSEITTTDAASGTDRAEAWRRAFKISKDNWMNGIGFGVYPIVEPTFSAPHSMLLLRLAEGGIFSLISFLLLAAYAPMQVLLMLRHRERDMLKMTCLIAMSSFMLKAVVFGATFSVESNIVWGFGFGICLAVSLRNLTPQPSAFRTGRSTSDAPSTAASMSGSNSLAR